MEELIQYVWKHKIYPLGPLRTTQGEEVEVVDPGLPNRNAGPDFFNAKVRIGGTLWVGNVEIHQRSSDWFAHGHQNNQAYNNVILHVVGQADVPVGDLPQLELSCPPQVAERYALLKRRDAYPACGTVVGKLPRLMLHSWMSALQAERLQERTLQIAERLKVSDQRWDKAFFITLSRNFGFGLNGDAFEAWAQRIDFNFLGKHRDNLQQVEAVFLGMAGLLEQPPHVPDSYFLALRAEWQYLRHKFNMPAPISDSLWRLARIRPGAFPHVKIAQLAWMCHHCDNLFNRLMEAVDMQRIREVLQVDTSPYWRTRCRFGGVADDVQFAADAPRRLASKSVDLITINTIVPFLYAYGRHRSDEALCLRASELLEGLPPEDNYIIRHWATMGVKADNAADSQALIQLRKQYCDRRDCLRCRIGYEYLSCKKG